MNNTPQTEIGTPSAFPLVTGSVIERHLIEDGWLMRADDEALEQHDCQTWWRLDSHPSGRWMIGAPYARGLFVPIRRAGPRPDPLAHLLTSQNGRGQERPDTLDNK